MFGNASPHLFSFLFIPTPPTSRINNMQQQLDAMNLPEIRTSIGPHLTLASLYSCVLVSKEWRASFTPFLWRTFYFGPYKGDISLDLPSQTSIQKYAYYIQHLIVRSLTPYTFQLVIFKNTPLTQLKGLYLCEAVGENKCTTGLGWLFVQNPGLTIVDYDGGHSKLTYGGGGDGSSGNSDIYHHSGSHGGFPSRQGQRLLGDFEVLLSRCPELTDLTTRFVDYDKKYRELLRRLCESRLRRMSFYINKFTSAFDEDLDDDTIRMPHLQELSIRCTGGARGGNSGGVSPGLETILGCPKLRVLRWFAASADPTIARFRKILEACPLLEAIELQHMVVPDNVIAEVLETMQALATEVIVPERKEPFSSGGGGSNTLGFKVKAFEALERRHFSTLVVLNIGTQSKEVTSLMILRVLSTCTRLKEITACQLMAKDIRDGPGVWACRRLEVFRVKIRGFRDPLMDRIRAAVFRRFATLPQLRVMHIGGVDRKEEGVVLRLECGLGQLVGLEDLESVSVFPGCAQKMRKEDVEWVRAHWQRLKVLEGDLHPMEEVSEAIREVLTSRGDKRREAAAEKRFEQFAFYTANHRFY